jgi:hypothetical protein
MLRSILAKSDIFRPLFEEQYLELLDRELVRCSFLSADAKASCQTKCIFHSRTLTLTYFGH